MLATSDLHRSIAKMTVDLARAIDERKHRPDAYRMGEREQQFQYRLAGKAGNAPIEMEIEIPFDIFFLGDAGFQRDSELEAPQVRSGFEIVDGAGGLIPYAYVKAWRRNDDLDYTGATVVAGVHAPGKVLPNSDPTPVAFKVVLHIAFQGYGAAWDADGPMDAGGT